MDGGGVTGVLGGAWRADVTAHGSVLPWDGTAPLDWHVAADDRWHSPATEPAVRQHRLDGAPVFETRVRIPGGDAVQRIWSVADAGGLTVIEVANESPLPIACAFTRPDVLTTRPPTTVPIQGIDLPTESTVVVPIGHRASACVAIRHAGRGPGRLPGALPDAVAVARGWVGVAERASRLVLPDAALVARVVTARSELLLGGPADADDDPIGYLVGVAELVRMGELTADQLEAAAPVVAKAAEEIARRPGWAADAGLAAAAVTLAAAGERRGATDASRIAAGRPVTPVADPPDAGALAVAGVERRLLRGTAVLPEGIPSTWRGAGFEASMLVAGPTTRVSFGVRWHGANPAVLWEVEGDPVELTAPAVDATWSTRESRGEALWRTASP
jgi:hypothetical protein